MYHLFLAIYIKARKASDYMLCQLIVRAGRAVTWPRARALLTLAALGHKHLTLAQAAPSIPQLARPGLRATTTSDQSGGDQSRVTKWASPVDLWQNECLIKAVLVTYSVHDVGPPSEAEIEETSDDCWHQSSGDGWKSVLCSADSAGGRGRQPGTQVGGEIGQRHGNIYESN